MEQALSKNVHNKSEQRKIDSIISCFSIFCFFVQSVIEVNDYNYTTTTYVSL